MRFLGTQIQDDIVLLDVRDNTMWLDAGLVTFAADWSFSFDVGMNFLEIHHPVPRVKEEKIVSRAEQFLLRLQPGEQFRRTNWTMTIGSAWTPPRKPTPSGGRTAEPSPPIPTCRTSSISAWKSSI